MLYGKLLIWLICGVSVVPNVSVNSRPEEATSACRPTPATLMLIEACPCPFIAIEGIQ